MQVLELRPDFKIDTTRLADRQFFIVIIKIINLASSGSFNMRTNMVGTH